MKRWIMGAVALLIVYGNLAVVFQPKKIGLKGAPGLPRPFVLHDAFLMTGMFNSYVKENWDFFIEGRFRQDGPKRHRWAALLIEDHFPLRRSITFTQLYAPHHWDMHGSKAQRAAWSVMATKIRARHNRLHPDRAVTKVRFGTLSWPMDPRGYYAGRRPGHERRRVWFSQAKSRRRKGGKKP
jgi:hypothetical protein